MNTDQYDPMDMLRLTPSLTPAIMAAAETFRTDLAPARFADLCLLVAEVEGAVSVAERTPAVLQAHADRGGQRN
jgi:hypothetical protein